MTSILLSLAIDHERGPRARQRMLTFRSCRSRKNWSAHHRIHAESDTMNHHRPWPIARRVSFARRVRRRRVRSGAGRRQGARHRRADGDAHGTGGVRQRAHRDDHAQRDRGRRRRRGRGRVPGGRRGDRRCRHERALRGDARHERVSVRAARRSRAGKRCGRATYRRGRARPSGSAVRSCSRPASRATRVGHRPHERDRDCASARRAPLHRRAGRHAARGQERRAAGDAVRLDRSRFGGERGLLGVALSRTSRATASSTCTPRAPRAACTTASAASPPTATSPPPAARRRWSTCRRFRRRPTTTAAACTSASTASSTSASARTRTRRRRRT